jgi:thiol-disulfide isomerase/thioredoxin
MGKAERNRRQSAREKIAVQQAAARRAEMRQRGLIAGGSVLVVIAIVVAFVLVKTASNSSAQPTATGATSQPASVMKDITSVPDATLTAIGAGSSYPHAIQTIKGNPPLLTQDGKPHIVYVGGEYCPYCAAERWAMVNALSRFGTFHGLGFIHSSAKDVYPSTPTLTFHKSSYTSKYVVFSPTEARNATNTANLEPLTKLDTDLMKIYDAPPYVPSASYDGSFPFMDFANRYVIDGASYNPAVLKGLTWAQVAAALKDPSSPVAKAADGTANLMTAAICKVTGGKPGSVCTAAGVTKASGAL